METTCVSPIHLTGLMNSLSVGYREHIRILFTSILLQMSYFWTIFRVKVFYLLGYTWILLYRVCLQRELQSTLRQTRVIFTTCLSAFVRSLLHRKNCGTDMRENWRNVSKTYYKTVVSSWIPWTFNYESDALQTERNTAKSIHDK